MVQAICKNPQISCVGVYDKNIDILMEKPDVVVDFSHPDFLNHAINKALQFNVPLVCGTTGLDKEKMALLKESSKKIPVVYSENFSVGIALLTKIFTDYNDKLKSYDKLILDYHHKEKRDAPSGTAIHLQEALKDASIASFRIGNIKGIHEIIFSNNDELITIKHEAFSRNVFALGVIKAIEFALQKNNGYYSFEDIIDEIK